MNTGFVLGTALFTNPNGVFLVNEKNGDLIPFFKVREIFRATSPGSYLAIDCDIKDFNGKREVKLAKSSVVAKAPNVYVFKDKMVTKAVRIQGGSLIIKVEQIGIDHPVIQSSELFKSVIEENKIEVVLRVTGNFCVGKNFIKADDTTLYLNRSVIRNCVIGQLKLK